MKKILCIGLICAVIMLLLPLSVIKNGSSVMSTAAMQNSKSPNTSAELHSTSFTVLNCEDNSITEISTDEYIFGVVAAEMPALYEPEALKAQAVAAYTFALRRKAENIEKPYDITTDHTTDQSYITKEKARKNWGNNADTYIQKIEKAVKDVKDCVILYDGKIITSVYHAISGGKTEDSINVWGVSLPYLKPVSSVGDTLAENYTSKTEFTTEELKNKLNGTVEIKATNQNEFKDIIRTPSGTVKTVTVNNKKIPGAAIRSALDLRSSNFEISYANNKYTFTVYGYGHGVGLSQNGANYMAKQGFNYKEILTHYYTGCTIEKHFNNTDNKANT